MDERSRDLPEEPWRKQRLFGIVEDATALLNARSVFLPAFGTRESAENQTARLSRGKELGSVETRKSNRGKLGLDLERKESEDLFEFR
jgi:hypothetical protein